MARLPDEVVERIKREISVQRLAEARGIKLQRSGKELIGLCPFHKDTRPSLNIDPVKNVWHCKGACGPGTGGSVIDWVMRAEGISTRHALELLSRDLVPLASAKAGPPPKQSTVPKLPPLFAPTVDDQRALQIVVNYYHETLKNSPDSPKVKRYLVQRGLESSEMIERFRLGFSNRTLNYHVPEKNRAIGEEIRGRLERLGILREKSGHEHFVGSLVIPILNLQSEVVQMYGRKITARLRSGTDYHLYLSGPLRGVWNEEALIASKEIILCEALIDALTFWCAGHRNVTTSYGVNGFTDDHRAAFQKYGTKKIYIAYDRDEAGDKAATKHAEELMQMGIECFRVKFPKGQDANEFALKTRPPGKALGLFLNSAEWLGKGKPPTVAVIEPAKSEPQPEPQTASQGEQPSAPAAEEKAEPAPAANIEEDAIKPAIQEKIPEPATTPAEEKISEPVPSLAAKAEEATTAAKRKNVPIEIKGDEVTMTFGDRRYRIRGLSKNMDHGALRVNVFVSRSNGRGEMRYFGNTFDLYQAKPRQSFAQQAAEELELKEEIVRRELGEVWLQLEHLQDEQIERTLAPAKDEVPLSEEERAAALELLRDPRLFDRVLADFEKCGVVGEETNKRIAYLAAVSRLLEKPLAIVVQSSSSAGKSSLMDAVLDFMPEEQRESYTAMTGQALFYMGQKNLKHKILAIAEQQGAEAASYPLKLLQSEGKLKIASTGKDPVSGKHMTHEYVVEGPVMIFLTTTAHEVDEELLNRCLVLTVNEEREQTRAIHQKQREAETLEGLKARMRQNKIVRLHRNVQRLLRPVQVVIEHLKGHSFPDTMTRTRRDHVKFLTLIKSITLLHQHQRETRTGTTDDGDTFQYIEASEEDVQLAWELANRVLVRSLDDLLPQTRRLLLLLDQMVSQECERLQIERLDYRFTRATVRRSTGWGDSQLKKHLSRLEDLEYLALHRGAPGQSFVYALNFEMDANGKPVLPGLSYGANRSRFQEGVSRFNDGVSRPGHGQVTGVSRGGRSEESPAMTRVRDGFSEKSGENAFRGQGAERIVVVAEAAAKPNGRMHAQAVK
jgi:DNA primase catalytic core